MVCLLIIGGTTSRVGTYICHLSPKATSCLRAVITGLS